MTRTLISHDALAALRADITAGVLAPGEQIVQETLAERYGVSRVPLREALKTLEAEGIVRYFPHRGYFVAELSVEELLEVYRLRELLEAEAITYAIPQLSDGDIDELAGYLDDYDKAGAAGDLYGVTEANRAFHFAIFDAAHMARLSRLLRQLWDATDAYRAFYYRDEANRARVSLEHREMLKALRARDITTVIQLHHDHRALTVNSVRSSLNQHRIQEEA
jgi:DNA-binding GntR family transcriptional regulator